MRSSKSRSRSKSNRNNRSVGNVVNRVFDSSGPEGKVRGTPQQIIDKYNQLARDAQLGNDRVATENFQQHAEHYTRMLAEALQEQNERQGHNPQGGQNQQGQGGQNRNDDRRDDSFDGQQDGGNDNRGDRNDNRGDRNQDRGDRQERPERQDRPERQPERAEQKQERQERQPERAEQKPERQPERQPDVIDLSSEGDDTNLVETPESRPRPRRTRRKAATENQDAGTDTPQPDAAE